MTCREQLLKELRAFGGDNSDAILDPACEIFRVPSIEGFIGYKNERGTCVVFGDPVTAPDQKRALAKAFREQHQGPIIYVSASEPFLCNISIVFGEKLFLNPQKNPFDNTGDKGSLVRRKVRRALREEVDVKEYVTEDKRLEQDIEQVGVLWLKSRRKPQVHISNVHLFSDRLGKRWFYATKGNLVIGVVLLNEIQAHQGWLLNHLMITPDAPPGTPELLVIRALEAVAKEGCQYVTFGTTPTTSLGKTTGLGRLSAFFASMIYRAAHSLFHLDGLNEFWGKFQPQAAPAYLLFSEKRIGPLQAWNLMRAINARL